MVGLLDALTPLASMLARTPAPGAAAASVARVLRSDCAERLDEVLRQHFGADAAWARTALALALQPDGTRADPTLRLAQAEVLALQIQRERSVAPALVMTIPDFLRQAWAEHLREVPATDWPRETLPAILDIATQAQQELLLAAPFLNLEYARTLKPSVARLTAAGGEVLVVTRGSDGPGMMSNLASLRHLRSGIRHPSRVKVWSWAGPGLGVHFKVIVADRQHGYLGSANFTTHGTLYQAEAGVLLHGPLARQLDHWIRKIAVQPPGQAGPA